MEILISKILINPYINHNVLKEYNEVKEEIKNPEMAIEYTM